MQSKSITFLRDVGLMLLLLYSPFFKSVAQQPTYIKPIKYTDVNFNVYFAHCDHPDVVYTVNGVPLTTTVLFASGGFIANRFDYGILKAGDTFTVTNTCDGTSISRIVEDDYSYIGIPNGSTYIGNGISPSDTDPPYTRLHIPVQLGKCEKVKNIRAHILDSYLFSMNANAQYGVFKHNGLPIKKSDYIEDHYGQTGVVWDINPDGSAHTDNPTTLTSLVSYSGNTPEIISYTHNGATITDDLTLQFGGLAIRYIKNGAYSIEKYTATQFERVDYTGNFENSTFEIRYGASKIEAWVDGVKVDELVREVVYSVSGGGSLSNTSVLPYGSSVDFTPTISGDYVISATINNVRRVEQKIHISSDPDGVNSVENTICNNGTGKITANINQKGYAPLSYRINGGSWGNSNVFPNLTPGNYKIEVKDGSGCTFTSDETVGFNSALPNLTVSNKTCSTDLTTYNLSFTSNGIVTSDYGIVSGNMVNGIPAGQSVTLTATSTGGCQTTLLVSAPSCSCPSVNAPVSSGDKVICSTSTIPSLNVTVGTNETANWYDGSGTLLSSGSTSYTPSASGTYYAEAQNTNNGCRSSSKTTVKLTINAAPNLTASTKTCSSDLKTYSVSFTSDGTVTSDYGVVSGNMVSGIPSGQSVTLTTTSTGGCQTTLLVQAPSCSCPSVNAPASSGDKVICSTSTIPSLNVTVGTNETANWYDGSGVLLLSGSTSFTPSASGTYYAEAQNTNNGCRSSSKTAVKLSINAAPTLTASNKNCSSDLKTYSVSFTSDGTVSSDYGVVSGNMVSGIPAGQSVTLIATSASDCQTTLLVSAPSCICPAVNAPVSTTGNQVSTCQGKSLPIISASVGVNETIDWYSASTGGILLEASSLSYQPKTVGTYFAEARNTINGCISSNRTAIIVSQNEQPKLSYSDVNCALNIKTYSLNFMSDGAVTSDYGTVSGNLVSGIPVGQTVTLTATSSSGCQTTQSVTAPTCKPCELILNADKSSIKQGESVSLSASGCPGTFSWINTGTEGSTIQVKPLVTTTYLGACWIDDAEPQCSSSITIEVSPCELSAIVSSDVINQGESVTLQAEGCLNGFIAWNVAGSESGVLTVSPLTTTTYTASCWYESGASSCQVSKTIIVNPCQLSATASSELIRQGESVTLRAEGCLNGFIAWDIKGSESGVLTVSPLSTTTYTASCWYSNSNGVPSCSISKTIVVNPCELKATASKERIRQGESVTLSAVGCLNGFIAWNVEGSESGVLTVSPLVTTTYTASCWYASGTSSCRVSKTIEVSPCQLSATASSEVINQGESVTLRAEGCLNGFIAWDVKGSESGVLTVSPLNTTTYTASCWYSNSNGASSCSISKTVVVNPCQLTITASADTINQGDSTVLTASGCASGKIVWDYGVGNEYQITVSPTIPTTYKVSCYYGDIEGCSYSKTIMVNPCQIHIIAEKPSIILGETVQLKVEGCRNGRVEWQGINNDSTTITVRPLETTTYLVKCFYGNDSLSSCDTSFELKVTPCQLSSKAFKSILTAGETLSIVTTGCLGTLVYSSDSTQNGKSSFELIPISTGSVRISCQIGDIISCDTTIKFEVQQCPSKIVVSKQILTIGESSTLEYVGCPNTVLWKELGTGATIRVNPEKNTMYYVSCRFGKDLAYSCANDSVLIKVKPLPPLLTNNRNGLQGTVIRDTVCLNTQFTIGVSCEGRAMAYTDGQVVSETKFQAKKVGLETYKYYCQSEDGEQSEVSTFEVLVKGFEVNDAIVYPVPTSGLLHIKSKGCLDNLHLVLYTLSGQMLYQGNGEYRDAESISIDMSYLPSDEYVLHVTGMEGSSHVTKRLRVVKYSK